MKQILSIAAICILAAAIFQYCGSLEAKEASVKSYLSKKKIIVCMPGAGASEDWLEDHPEGIPALQGWGNYTWKVSTISDSAQFYFNQGINMYYSFHMVESYASFAKATQFDSNLGIAYWGQALTKGPNINYPDVSPDANKQAASLIKNAKANVAGATPFEKQLVAAIEGRYSSDTTNSRDKLNENYATAMKIIYKNNSTNADALALYADALMVQHPWDLYHQDETPKSWTPALVALIESGLTKFPEHPALNHYYIHAVEASSKPGRALQSAYRLSTMMPMVAHMVHMPSHIYIRTGNYQRGIDVNTSAFTGFSNYRKQFPAVEELAALYLSHNQHMQVACALMAGESKYAAEVAATTKSNIPDDYFTQPSAFGNYVQSIHMLPFIVAVRFGKWQQLIDSPMVKETLEFEYAYQLFAKGMALAGTGRSAEAKDYILRLQEKIKTPVLHEVYASFANPGSLTLEICLEILRGTVAEKTNDIGEAITHFQNAVHLEDGMLYNEPKDCLVPARHYLGFVLLKAKKFAQAEEVYRADLQKNPYNPWSILGLGLAQKALGKSKNCQATKNQFVQAAKHADISFKASIVE